MGALWGPNLRKKWTIYFKRTLDHSGSSSFLRTHPVPAAQGHRQWKRLLFQILCGICGRLRSKWYVTNFSISFKSFHLENSITSVNCKKVKSGWALTSCMNWRPRIPMDWRLSWLILTQHNTSPITASSRSSVKFIDSIILPCIQVSSAEGYQLTVTGFSPSSSTLHDGMKHNNGMNFTTLWEELFNDRFFTYWFFLRSCLRGPGYLTTCKWQMTLISKNDKLLEMILLQGHRTRQMTNCIRWPCCRDQDHVAGTRTLL